MYNGWDLIFELGGYLFMWCCVVWTFLVFRDVLRERPPIVYDPLKRRWVARRGHHRQEPLRRHRPQRNRRHHQVPSSTRR